MSLMQRILRGGRRGLVAAAATAVLAAGGGATIAIALTDQPDQPDQPPQPAPAAAGTRNPTPPPAAPPPDRADQAPTGTATASARPDAGPSLVLPASAPTSLSIPAIGVRSGLLRLGRNTDGSVQVPGQPLKAGWYRNSATPGQIGASVVLGHVDSEQTGPAVFYRLGAMVAGEKVTVTRADRSTATFTVTAVREYPKDHFPTLDVYTTPSTTPQLRLITCGDWNPSTHSYLDNTVVFAALTSVTR
ncbi:class F sortase [Streptomyces polygonati]|uniref:Class F sortase n=1 Tax=Streptomyces polygonati TaxID=1617087 RepID=A0ABV8HVJ2_9ACTN